MKPGGFWWENEEAYWDLPFYADMGLSCEVYNDRAADLAGREQLWAIREGLKLCPELQQIEIQVGRDPNFMRYEEVVELHDLAAKISKLKRAP